MQWKVATLTRLVSQCSKLNAYLGVADRSDHDMLAAPEDFLVNIIVERGRARAGDQTACFLRNDGTRANVPRPATPYEYPAHLLISPCIPCPDLPVDVQPALGDHAVD